MLTRATRGFDIGDIIVTIEEPVFLLEEIEFQFP